MRAAMSALANLVPEDGWLISNEYPPRARAPLGPVVVEVLIMCINGDGATVPHIIVYFDEEEVVILARKCGLTICELLSPYVGALQTIPTCTAVGMGFELSPTTGLDDRAIESAGISQYFTKEAPESGWMRREIYPMVGHYL